MARNIDVSKLDLSESIINIRRVTKVVKGGKNSRFSVTVVVGDKDGHVGLGLGKSVEIPEAVRKASDDAKKSLITVPMVGTTIPHRSLGVFGAGKVLLMPAAPGTGVIAGGAARTVLEFAGNVAYATIEGLKELTTIEEVAALRGLSKEEILG